MDSQAEKQVSKCQAKLTSGKQGRPLRIRCCGRKAIVLTPTGFFEHGRQVWFCELHAPTKLLPRIKAPNVL